MNPEMERRTYDAELRVDSAGYGKKAPTIRGYAAKFNTLSQSMPIYDNGVKIGTFREMLIPGCFAAALPVSDIRSLFNHDPNLIMGRNTAGTLRLKEDDVGLYFENDPPETSYSKDLQISINRGDVNQCSFGFNVAEGGDDYRKDPDIQNGYIRSIRSISKLYDASPVTYPAYLDTDCAVRSIVSNLKAEEAAVKAAIEEEKEAERRHQLYIKRKRLELAELGV
jgi:HK97 family phage prohead protease